jgi:hypothetical protein
MDCVYAGRFPRKEREMPLRIVSVMAFMLLGMGCSFLARQQGGEPAQKPVVVWQPSHQNDTGGGIVNEALVCNAIVEAALSIPTDLFDEYKVWSYYVEGLHHAQQGSNTMIAHTTAVVDGKISGYAYELQKSNAYHPKVFIAVHNNAASRKNGCWGFIHGGDAYEDENRKLAEVLARAVCDVTGMEYAGVKLDSWPQRNDYRCKVTGELAFYSIDENVNTAPYRVLLEIGDQRESRDILMDPEMQKKMGIAIKKALIEYFPNLK